MNMKRNLLCTVFSELKISRRLIVLYAVILSTMFTLLLSMLSFAEHIPYKMEQQLDERLEGSIFKADILSLTSENAELLDEIPASGSQISFLAESVVLDGAYVISSTAESEGEGIINICTAKSGDSSHISEGRDIEFSDNTSGEYSLWLSESCALRLNAVTGDALVFTNGNNIHYSAAVEGIYYDAYNEAPFMINAPLARAVLEESGKSTRQSCRAEFSSYSDCRNAVSILEKNGCEVRCTLYDKTNEMYDNIRYMNMIFIIISLVLFICLGIILYAMNSMLIDVRAGYIAMLRCLGAKKSQIVSLYLMICEPVLVTGILAGCIFSRAYISYTAELMDEYLSLSVSAENMSPSIKTAMTAFIGANIVLTAVFGVMYRRISGISAAALFSNAESDR